MFKSVPGFTNKVGRIMTNLKDDSHEKDTSIPLASEPSGEASKKPALAPGQSDLEPIGLVEDPQTDSRNWPIEKKSQEGNYEVGEPVPLPVSIHLKTNITIVPPPRDESAPDSPVAATPPPQIAAPSAGPSQAPAPALPRPPMRHVRIPAKVSIVEESSGLEVFLIKLRQTTPFTPLVGTFVGLGTGTLIVVGSYFWPIWLSAVVGLTAEMVITGARYESGVGKFTDAFWRARTGEDMHENLESPPIGGYGAAGLIFAILLRAGAIGAIGAAGTEGLRTWHVIAAVVASATIGRWIMLATMASLPSMEDLDSDAKDIKNGMGLPELAKGTLLAVPGLIGLLILFPEQFAVAVFILILTIPRFIHFLRRALGAYTEDCLGIGCYIGQVVVLLAAAMYHHSVPA